MESLKKKPHLSPNPRAKANTLSALTFSWTLGLFKKGFKRDLELSDLCTPLEEHESKRLGDDLEEEWEKQLASVKGTTKEPSLARCLIKVFGCEMLALALGINIFDTAMKLGQPILLGKLLNYFTPNSTMTFEEAKIYAAAVAACVVIHQMSVHPFIMALTHMGLKMRVALSSLIYRKLLKVSSSAHMGVTGGYLINLLTNDVSRFDFAPLFLPDLYAGIIVTVIVTYCMWNEVGLTAFVGISVLVLFVPLQVILAKKSTTLREATAVRTDKRVQLMNEIISGIQAIKMYAWENPFAKLVETVRRKEVRVIRTKLYYSGLSFACSMFLTKIALFVSMVYYALLGNPVTAETIFVMTLYYSILQDNLTIYFPLAVQKWAECRVSVGRVREYLRREEAASITNKPSSPGGSDIILKDVYAKWSEDQHNDTLENLNIVVNSGMLVGLIGQVGSGKSSLLQLVLKEMPRTRGLVNIRGSVSYSSQEAWLFGGSICENILFGLPMDKQRYKEVVRVCALEPDFEQFSHGDKTLIGERGTSLSGGQRARVNLARAVYRRADIYLLDDPLSAVDTHVGRHIFDDCIRGFLAGKTVILSTHQLQYISYVDHIVIMEDGMIKAQGTFSELQNAGEELSKLIKKQEVKQEEEHGEVQMSRRLSLHSVDSEENMELKEEMRTSGKVGWKVYQSYIEAGCNIPAFLLLVFLLAVAQALSSGSEYWTAYWVDLEQYVFQQGNTTYVPILGEMNQEKCLWVYGILIVLVVILNVGRTVAFFFYSMQASKRLHDTMFRTVSQATMYFFNNNPSGRILNRFSRDVGMIDENLPDTLMDLLQTVLRLLGVLCVITVVNYWLILPFFLMGALFMFIRQYFVATSRSLKRLEGLTRSPLFTHSNATLQGLATIRSMHASDDLRREFDTHQDLNSAAVFYSLGVNRAFGYWLDLICSVYMILVLFSFLFLDMGFKGGEVGLTVTQALTLTFMCQWVMRRSAEVENYMTSVERVLEFHKVESEEEKLQTPPEKNLSKNWPVNGDITFKNVFLRYDPKDLPVLRNLNFSIRSGEKIGIVGRTGAGKSSLMNALFRLHPLEGAIIIDGIDTCSIGLHDLRSRMSVIPQEPVLFTGSLRHNLDPFEQFNDNELWQVLEEVELKSVIEDMPGGLSSGVTEGGNNLSVGQRQLVCLARAILRKAVILVLDEATANMDPYTDQLIQATLRLKFSQCTVLTIAHRLPSVIDADRILVMDAGQVAEFGEPYELLQKPHGYLTSLVNQTGTSDSNNLRAMAESMHLQRHSDVLKKSSTVLNGSVEHL